MECVRIERWKLYTIRFFLLFLIPPTMAALFELPRTSVVRLFTEGLAVALALTLIYWLVERQSLGE
jgi:hypothetical protein